MKFFDKIASETIKHPIIWLSAPLWVGAIVLSLVFLVALLGSGVIGGALMGLLSFVTPIAMFSAPLPAVSLILKKPWNKLARYAAAFGVYVLLWSVSITITAITPWLLLYAEKG